MTKYRAGRISEIDNDKGLFRVRFAEDNIVSPWLSGLVPNTKNNKWALPYTLNEHVACLLDDDAESGVILGAIYSAASQPSITGGKFGVTFSDDSKVEFNPSNGKLTVDAKGLVEIKAAPKVVIDADLEVKGKIDVTGNVRANGEVTARAATTNVSLSTHIHPHPQGPTSSPTPGT